MLPHKRKPSNCEPAPGRLKDRVGDLFLSNKLSASETVELATDAHAAGATGLNELAGVGKRRKDQTAQPRELRTLLGRNRHWPPLFKFQAPVWDRKQQKEVTQTLRMLLPHECLFVMFEKADGCTPLCQQEWLQDVEAEPVFFFAVRSLLLLGRLKTSQADG